MRHAPVSSQPPQASASTNSAIRAVSSFPDEECPKTDAVSSAAAQGEKFQVESVAEKSREDGAGNQMRCGVYFIGNHDNTRVKIGKSRDIAGRFRDLSRMNGAPIFLLAEVRGYTEVEKFMHRRFDKARQHGEWFALTPPIAALIEQAKANRDLTIQLCARAVKNDERPVFEHVDEPELDLDRDPVGGDDDILRRWRDAGGIETGEPVPIEWSSIGLWGRRGVDREGAWVHSSGTVYVTQSIGLARCAGQLVEFDDPRERQLAFIEAAARGRYGDLDLRGKFHGFLVPRLRRLDLGSVKHTLPNGWHHCNKCRDWSSVSATSSGEWLARLAHITTLEDGVRLARVVGIPEEDMYWRTP